MVKKIVSKEYGLNHPYTFYDKKLENFWIYINPLSKKEEKEIEKMFNETEIW